MQFSDFTLIYKPMLISTLKECISNICDITEENHPQWRKTIKKHLLPYILAGKMNRGLLCVYSYKHIYNATLSLQKEKDIYVLAAILELLQSFLLIHDDIMDKDILRRGMASMHILLAEQHLHSSFSRTTMHKHGEALAICLGDVVFSYAIKLLSMIMPQKTVGHTIEIVCDYICKVGVAQMDDIHWEITKEKPSMPKILKMYKGKTGYYTFTLPLVLAYMYSCKKGSIDSKEIKKIEKLGGLLGIAFQIKDDVLDLYDSNVSKKTQGSDIKRKKNTFLQAMFYKQAKKYSKQAKLNVLLEGTITKKNITTLLECANKWEVWGEINKKSKGLEDSIKREINTLNISAQAKKHLEHIAKQITIEIVKH